MLLLVAVGVELANLDVRRSCRTVGRVKNRGVVEHVMAGCRVSVVLMSRYSRSCVAVLGVSEVAMGSAIESPLLPFQRDVLSFSFNVILFEVCPQSVTTPRQHHGKPTVYFLSVLIVEVSPAFGVGATHNFGLHPEECSPNSLFIFFFSSVMTHFSSVNVNEVNSSLFTMMLVSHLRRALPQN